MVRGLDDGVLPRPGARSCGLPFRAHSSRAVRGFLTVRPVTEPYDVIAIVEAASIDALGKIVVSRIQVVKEVTRTLTCPVVHI